MIASALRILLQLLAGVGIGAFMDKVASDKLPSYPKEGITPKDTTGKINVPKIAYWLAAGLVGALAWAFISKKLKIKI